MLHWLKYIDYYEQGHITAMELRYQLVRLITEDNLPQILQRLPEETKDLFREFLEPRYEDTSKFRYFCIDSWILRTDEDIKRHKEKQEQDHQDYCKGVRIIRKLIDKI